MLRRGLFWDPQTNETNAFLHFEWIEAKCHWIPLLVSGFRNQFILFVTGFHNLSIDSAVGPIFSLPDFL